MTEQTPLESYVRDYVDQTGGIWDEVEPQVYDLLLPTDMADSTADRDVVRVTFDPEALPEHPEAQLAGFGTPLVDRLLHDGAQHGQFARAYVSQLNLSARDVSAKVRRTLDLAEGLQLELGKVRTMDFPQSIFWFELTLVSDQKESYILPIAMDLHYTRQVRHLQELLSEDHLSREPQVLLPQANRCRLAEAYPIARAEVVRTLGALAGGRRRELSERIERQVARMTRYYADLRGELNTVAERAKTRGDDLSKYSGRRSAIDREEQLRVAELRQKSSLQIRLRLANLLIVHQPKLSLAGAVSVGQHSNVRLSLIWDPLLNTLEAIPCPSCLCPTFRLQTDARHQVICPACSKNRVAR